jgi:hypothetical protein
LHPLARLAIPFLTVAISLVFAVGVFAGAVRAMPWLVDPAVPLAVVWPFARELARAGFEAALLMGVPIGVCTAVAVFVDRGEARALLALGQSPCRMALVAAGPAALAAFVGLLIALSPRPDAGRLARELLVSGRLACLEDVTMAHSVQVPVVGVSWLCFPGRPPRVVGVAPGLGRRARFSAADMSVTDRLDRLELEDVRVQVPRSEAILAFGLRVRRATVRGLVPWASPTGATGGVRAGAVALAELVTAVILARGLIAYGIRGRALPVLAAAVGGSGLLALLRVLDRIEDAGRFYPLLPIFIGVIAWLLARALHVLGSIRPSVAGAGAR